LLLFGGIDGVSAPPPLVGAGTGGGSRGPLWYVSPLPCGVGQRDPPPYSSPARGEETHLDNRSINSRANGARLAV
jgi:hypothetical protein